MSTQFSISSALNRAITPIRLFFVTLSYLKLSQLFFLFYRRVLPRPFFPINANPTLNSEFSLLPSFDNSKARRVEQGFCFINLYEPWSLDDAQWDRPAKSMLWRYNLHYFDWLRDAGTNYEWKQLTINEWVKVFQKPSSPAWDPYTTSLRIVNWIKFFSNNSFFNQDKNAIQSLYQQGRWLANNLELDILANHYFKNIVALFFWSHYFDDGFSRSWRLKSSDRLIAQMSEQFLESGAHYERSPMYHSITLEDVMDLINLINSNSAWCSKQNDALLEYALSVAEKGIKYLSKLTLNDGNIALFNDSAWENAPELDVLEKYFFDLTGRKVQREETVSELLSDIGIFVHKDEANAFVVDCGEISPAYQPGHAHAGIGTFEWVVAGQRVIVDTGTFDYSASSRRLYSRSTRAHNTVCLDGKNQSELWNKFRAGERAEVLSTSFSGDNQKYQFEVSYRNSNHRKDSIKIQRVVNFNAPGSWIITDCIFGKNGHLFESFLHIHPCHKVVIRGEYAEIKSSQDEVVALIEKSLNLSWELIQAEWYPQFNVVEQLTKIRLFSQVSLPFRTELKLRII